MSTENAPRRAEPTPVGWPAPTDTRRCTEAEEHRLSARHAAAECPTNRRGIARTLSDYYAAADSTGANHAPSRSREAADRLPLSDWSEARRDILSPQTVAANWLLHLSDKAHALRELVELHDDTAGREALRGRYIDPQTAADSLPALAEGARDLLRALGELGAEYLTPERIRALIAESVTETEEQNR